MTTRGGQLLVLALLGLPIQGAGGSRCDAAGALPDEQTQAARRAGLVEKLSREIQDARVLSALGRVPRHRFVPPDLQREAYLNQPLPIGAGQTISQPFIVAYMTQALGLTGRERVLEIGTGSGYQAAVLAELCAEVYTVEILPALAERARRLLGELGYRNIRFKVGDGYEGWREQAPYDAIIVTAAPARVPEPLIAQLKEGGRLSIPLGSADGDQVLYTYVLRDGKLIQVDAMPVRFVPMTGKARR